MIERFVWMDDEQGVAEVQWADGFEPQEHNEELEAAERGPSTS